ncbi:hypothetical protein DAI22_11g219300 [Oryza sativa Japonica Group]|nr:hypothetical protein DAI22_11g219300 [Oryza sativa Japonica Group]
MAVGLLLLHVQLDAASGVEGELHHLLHPRPEVVVAAGPPVRRHQVAEQVVHALHLVHDELHVVAGAAQQPGLVADEPQHHADGAQSDVSHSVADSQLVSPISTDLLSIDYARGRRGTSWDWMQKYVYIVQFHILLIWFARLIGI